MVANMHVIQDLNLALPPLCYLSVTKLFVLVPLDGLTASFAEFFTSKQNSFQDTTLYLNLNKGKGMERNVFRCPKMWPHSFSNSKDNNEMYKHKCASMSHHSQPNYALTKIYIIKNKQMLYYH